jgi:hypothetical protein
MRGMTSRPLWAIGALCLLVACESEAPGKTSDGAPSSEVKKKSAEPKKKAGVRDWSGDALRTAPGLAGKLRYTIDLPADLRPSGGGTLSTYRSARWGDGVYTDLEVSVHAGMVPPSLESVIENKTGMGADDHVVKTKEDLADGFLVTHHSPDKSVVQTILWRMPSAEDKGQLKTALACVAKQSAPDGVPNFEATVAQLEKICRSLAIDGTTK